MKSWKNVLNVFGALVFIGLGIAVAQNINRSVQLSQSPLGPIGFDTLNNVFFPNHINNSQQQPPSLTSCGTTPSIVGTDTAGGVTEGSGSISSCTITFRTAFNTSPFCTVTPSIATQMGVAATAGGVTFSHAVNPGSVLTLNYVCMGGAG